MSQFSPLQPGSQGIGVVKQGAPKKPIKEELKKVEEPTTEMILPHMEVISKETLVVQQA